jgi:hypothetical protein
MPLWAGPQAPCNSAYAHRIDPATAEAQGHTEAAAAAAAAASLALSGTVIYYDMENYDTSDGSCATAVKDFVKGWVTELQSGSPRYLAGVYSNPYPIQQDISQVSPLPDAIWIAHYDNKATILDGIVDDSLWPSHQRIRQYKNYDRQHRPGSETYGGVAFICDLEDPSHVDCIDRDILDAPVAGGDGTKNYSSWTPTLFNYPYTPPDTAVYGINTAFMGQGSAEPGYLTGYATADSGSGTNEGFYWNGASFTLINNIVGGSARPFGINNLGKIVGYYYRPEGGMAHGFKLDTNSGTSTTFDAPPSWGATETHPQGTNDGGQIVGYWGDSSGKAHGFLVDAQGNRTSLDHSGAKRTYLIGINGQGQVSGFYVDGKQMGHGFVYSMVDGWVEVAPTVCSRISTAVLGVNNNGQVIGNCPSIENNIYNPNVFLYDVAHRTSIPVTTPAPPCTGQQAWGVNDSAVAAGTTINCNGDDLAQGFYSTPNP